MRLDRDHLTTLLNGLYDRDDDIFEVRHPVDEIGPLLTIELGGPQDCVVDFRPLGVYDEGRQTIRQRGPTELYEDLPAPDTFLKAVLASGILELANADELDSFLDQYGDPDLMAGHEPVFAGFDTNLLPWRIDRLLGLHDPEEGLGYVNGVVLSTGVREELDWDYKCHNTDPFVEAAGDRYEAYWNQPLGDARVGRLGLQNYRSIRDIEQAVEVDAATGDDAIVTSYDGYNQKRRCDLLVFSNDRTFVERARSHRLLGHRVEFPTSFPDRMSATWRELEHLLYYLAIVFGIIEVPNTTIYGIWNGKEGLDWHRERVKLDIRSPVLRSAIERDHAIVTSYEDHQDR